MKCVHCNVELGSNNRYCPLCGTKAVNSKERITCATASYPKMVIRKTVK